MPKPNPNESEQDYVSRAIPIIIKEGATSDNKQATAIAYSMFRQHKKKNGKYANYRDQKMKGAGE
jgi:hypothetical protein